MNMESKRAWSPSHLGRDLERTLQTYLQPEEVAMTQRVSPTWNAYSRRLTDAEKASTALLAKFEAFFDAISLVTLLRNGTGTDGQDEIDQIRKSLDAISRMPNGQEIINSTLNRLGRDRLISLTGHQESGALFLSLPQIKEYFREGSGSIFRDEVLIGLVDTASDLKESKDLIFQWLTFLASSRTAESIFLRSDTIGDERMAISRLMHMRDDGNYDFTNLAHRMIEQMPTMWIPGNADWFSRRIEVLPDLPNWTWDDIMDILNNANKVLDSGLSWPIVDTSMAWHVNEILPNIPGLPPAGFVENVELFRKVFPETVKSLLFSISRLE